jgi:bifunctional UDP-N-acetylglucosamine pyrophosphorylase/glucosamine-1-phosphate N-acetyltransferase
MAAGKATRTYPLTLTRTKPLLKAANETVLEHNLEQLKGLVDEVIIIVGYKKDMIKQHVGNSFNNLKITYVEQKEQLGTGHCLTLAKDFVDEKFLIMNGDDLFFEEDIKKLLQYENAALVKKSKHPERFGVYVVEKGIAKDIVEKPEKFVSDLVNIGCYVFNKKNFDFEIKKSKREEYEITDFVKKIIEENKLEIVEAENWFPVTYCWDLLKANEFLLSKIKTKIDGKVEKNVVIKGNIIIGKNSVVKSNSYIEGPVMIGEDCTIGPNCYLRPSTTIGNNCKIGFEVEIKNSIISDHTNVPHLSYIGDSILGENVNFAGGSITANFRHDAGIIRSSIKKELIETGLNKLGTVIGDNVKLGIKTLIYPGRKIWPGKSTLPGETVKKDIE